MSAKAEDFPPKTGQNIMEWLQSTVPAERVAKDLAAVRQHLKEQHGVEKAGIVGFCWGGYMALLNAEHYAAVASPHPSRLTEELVQQGGRETQRDKETKN